MEFAGDPDDPDSFVAKVDGTGGSDMWTTQFGGSSSWASFQGVMVDAAGDVIAVGTSGDEDAFNFRCGETERTRIFCSLAVFTRHTTHN